MAKRVRVHRRSAEVSKKVNPSTKVELEDEDLEIEEGELEDEDLEDEDLDVEDDEEEEPPRRTPKRLSEKVAKPAEVAKPVKVAKPKKVEVEVEDDEEEEVAPKAKKETPVIKSVNTQIIQSVVAEMFAGLEEGKAILIVRKDENKWVISKDVAPAEKLRGKEYWMTVRDPKYMEWREEWKQKSFEEKVAFAKKNGAKWEPAENQRIEEMRVSQVVREKLNIEKYKPEYRSRAARAAIKG